jgi:hypothetical protein
LTGRNAEQRTIAMAVIGASPVTFISENAQPGKQFQVPLSRLTIDPATGTIDPKQWLDDNNFTSNSPDRSVLGNLLLSLVNQGFLTKPPT